MTAYNSQAVLVNGLRKRLQRVLENHMGNNWPEALDKIHALMQWIKEAEAK
jgi:hypothetical protein